MAEHLGRTRVRWTLGAALWALAGPVLAAELDMGELDFTVGPQHDGAIGVLLKGTEGGEIGWFTSSQKLGPEQAGEGFSRSQGMYQWIVDAGWQSGSTASNVSRISLQAGAARVYGLVVETSGREGCESEVQVVPLAPEEAPPPKKKCRYAGRDEFLAQVFLDGSYRVGAEPEVVTDSHVKQWSMGIGFSLWWLDGVRPAGRLLQHYPKVSLAYMHTVSGEGSPSNDSDRILLEASTRFRVPTLADIDKYTKLSIDLGYTWSHDISDTPDEAESGLLTIQASYDLGRALKPTLVFREGRESGFEYDRQVILGVSVPLDVLP